MPSSWNAAVAWENLADAGTITASSFAPLTPPDRLQDPHIARKWRGLSSSAAVTVDLGSAVSIDTVMMLGLNLSAAGATRVRASVDDSSALDAGAFDSGSLAGRVDPRYAMLLLLMPAPVTAQFVRIDLEEPGATFLEAGRLFVGLRHQFEFNFSYGWSRSWVDRSRRTESRGGQTYVDVGTPYRRLEANFEEITEEERFAVVEEIDRLNGERSDILFVTRSDSDNLGRDSIWGLVEALSPVTQPNAGLHDGRPLYAKTFSIRERL